MQACGSNVRSAVQAPSRAKIGTSQLGGGGGGGSGGFGEGGEGGSPIFSAMLAAKFGATLQQSAERRRLAGSSPTLSSPTHSAPPSPPQSPPADGSSRPPSPPTADGDEAPLGGRPSLGSRPSGRSGRFSLSRQLTRNSNSARTSTSSEPEASPGGTQDGTTPGGTPGGTPPVPKRLGLTRQATVGRLSHAAHEAAHNVSHAGGSVRARLARQKTSSSVDENSPKSSRRARSSKAVMGANPKKEVKLTQAERPC